jgi:hypothetical protein
MKTGTKAFLLIFGLGLGAYTAGHLLGDTDLRTVSFLVLGMSLPAAFHAFRD